MAVGPDNTRTSDDVTSADLSAFELLERRLLDVARDYDQIAHMSPAAQCDLAVEISNSAGLSAHQLLSAAHDADRPADAVLTLLMWVRAKRDAE